MSNKPRTVEEYLASGKTITKCPVVDGYKPQVTKSVNPGPAIILSLEEGDLFYGEKSKRTKKEKKPDLTGIDLSNIPEDLKKILGI